MITIERTTGRGSYDSNGKFISPGVTQIQIQGSIQPGGDKFMIDEEGRRNISTITIFTTEDIYTSNVKDGTKADVVIYEGRRYEIDEVVNWSSDPFNFHLRGMASLEAS